jgi:hypothetical protein
LATNFYFQSGIPGGRTSEQRLIENLIMETIKIYGFDLFYLPRTEVNPDTIFLDDSLAKFENAIPIESYLENVDGFGGDGELMSKFGIEIRDTATFVMSRSRWEDVVGAGRSNTLPLPNRPSEGDILYMPLTKSYFEIKRVDVKNPFYQLGKLHVYRLQCELWQYSSEAINTGVTEIDSLEERSSLNSSLAITISQQDPLADNEDFDLAGQDILDFSEINPFGEVIR